MDVIEKQLVITFTRLNKKIYLYTVIIKKFGVENYKTKTTFGKIKVEWEMANSITVNQGYL